MDGDSTGKIILIAILILFSAFFSASETAFTSLNRIRLKNAVDNGDKKAAWVLRMSENFDKLLTTVLVGNNIVNILASSIATVLFVDIMTKALESAEQGKTVGTTVATVVITVVVLIFGEVCPKGIAKESPEKFAMLSAPFLQFLWYLFTPVSAVLIGIRKLFSLIFKNKDAAVITEEEIITFVEEAMQEGGIDEQESELIRSAVEFNDREAQEILTHRVDIEAVSDETTEEEIEQIFSETGFSRLPVYSDTIDNIIGVIHHKDYYNKVKAGKCALKDIIKDVIPVHKAIKISDLLKLLQQSKSHMAVVADDYGGTLGIITMEDIIEELVGEIWDEHDEIVEELVELEEGSKYRVLCSMALDRAFETFDIRAEVDENTVGGWVSSELDKIPEEGDTFSYMNLDVIVTKTDSRRVVEIEVTVIPPEVMEEREREREQAERDADEAKENGVEVSAEEPNEAFMD